MICMRLRRAAIAIAVSAIVAGTGFGTTLAQDYGSAVSAGGGVSEVGNGETAAVAPGVIISGGEVSNTTGIGIDSGGGSSIGATGGGSDSAAVVE